MPINILLHTYGALAFWDYAAAAPYVKVDVNPMASTEQERGLVHMDAVFISPHKMIGGPGTPGVLVAKKFLFDRKLSPCSPGGGTVDFVTEDDQLYLTKIAHREESGTPDIVGCIRAGLVFQLKHAVTPELIESLERKLWIKAVSRLESNPRIHIMGQITYETAKDGVTSHHLVHRVPTLSFLIYHQSGKILHFNFVCALLDNLFGIQSRGGCVCAGPYGEYLLSMDKDTAKLYEEQVAQYDDVGVLRPGFVRLSLNFFNSEEEVDYILNAVDFVATEGWKLLPEYSFQPETGEWMHLSNKSLPNRKWLGEINYAGGKMSYPKSVPVLKDASPGILARQFADAKVVVQKAAAQVIADHREAELSQKHELMREDAEELRWFVYPDEAYLSVIEIENDSGLPAGAPGAPENVKPRGVASNFHSPAWREKWLDICPLAPRYFDYHPQAIANVENDSPASLMPKTHRFTATVTDLDSALNAKSQYTAKQMHLEQAEKAAQEAIKVEAELEAAPVEVNGHSNGHAEEKKSEFVIPETSQTAAVRSSEEEQERRLEEAVFVDDSEGLATHTHHADEEEEDDADMCCPIVPGGASACGVPAAGFGDSRSSVKTMIDTRKKEKKEIREQTERNDKRQSEEAAAKRKEQKLARFDPVDQIEHRIFKQMIAAIRMFDLIGPGDKVLVGVSGGKDSLTLLNMLLKAQKYLPFQFEVGAVTVDPQTLEFDPSPLKVYMAELGVKYFYDSQPLISIANDIGPSSICAWCSRMKRGILHNVCEREGYNVLALGQHLDDLVESFLMYGFHNGKLDTMKASSLVRNGKLKIVRPFVFVREKDNKHYANLSNLPVITENCPACFEEPKERARIKALLKAQERLYPNLFGNLLSAIKPLMHPDLKLDETLIELDKTTKAQSAIKYYPNRRSEEEQAAYRAKREAHKALQKAQAAEARAKAKASAKEAKDAAKAASSSAPSST